MAAAILKQWLVNLRPGWVSLIKSHANLGKSLGIAAQAYDKNNNPLTYMQWIKPAQIRSITYYLSQDADLPKHSALALEGIAAMNTDFPWNVELAAILGAPRIAMREPIVPRELRKAGTIYCATDGACTGNGRAHARASYGFCLQYFNGIRWKEKRAAADVPRHFVAGGAATQPSNNRGELLAALRALEYIDRKGWRDVEITLVLDSMVVIWATDGVLKKGRPLDKYKNLDILEPLCNQISKLEAANCIIHKQHVNSHLSAADKARLPIKMQYYVHLNECADKLAADILK